MGMAKIGPMTRAVLEMGLQAGLIVGAFLLLVVAFGALSWLVLRRKKQS